MKSLKSLNSRGSGIALSYVYTLLNMLCGVFLSSFLIRILGKTEYGVYQTISSFATYLVLLEFGTGTVMTRNIAACRGRNASQEEIDKNISTLWTVSHVLSFIIIIASVIFYFLIDSIYAKSMTAEQLVYAKGIFVLVAGHLVISFYLQTVNGIALGFEKYSFISIQHILKVLLRTGLLVGVILIYRKAIAIAEVDIILIAGIFIFVFFYCKKVFRTKFGVFRFDKTIFKTALPLCAAIFLQTIVNQANNNVDKFIIGIKISPEAVTMYSIGLYIFTIFSSLTTIPVSMYAPQVSMDMSRGLEGDALTEKLIAPCRLTAVTGGAILFGFIAAGRQFIDILYGEEYSEAWIIAIILIAPSFINMLNGVLINVLNYLNKRMVRSVALFITTVANIVLTIFWIDIWGMTGAAAATCVCTVVGQIIIMNIYYAKALKIRVVHMLCQALKGILIYQIIGAAAGFAVGYFIKNTFLSFIAAGLTFVIIFGAGYLIFGATPDEKKKFAKILHRRKK